MLACNTSIQHLSSNGGGATTGTGTAAAITRIFAAIMHSDKKVTNKYWDTARLC